MKKHRFLKYGFVLVLILALTVVAYAAGTGTTGIPGDQSDPLVSKSYVDARISYIPLQLQAGQKLIGGEGTEIILRSGEAVAIDNGANGVSDLTDGKDLRSGNKISLNHLLMVPRADGRGLQATTEGWVMIRGNYTIEN